MRRILIILALCLPCSAQFLSNGIIATSRAQDWTVVGLPSQTLPDGAWTQFGSTLNAGTYAASTITSNLVGCSGGKYYLLGPGTFTITGGGIQFPANTTGGCVLRGSGANSTFLNFTGSGFNCGGFGTAYICIESNDPSYPGNGSNTVYNWTAGYAQGATQITLSSVSGIVLNKTLLVLNQCDTGFSGSSCTTGSAVDNGNYFECSASYNSGAGTGCSADGPDGNSWRANAWESEWVTVTAINPGGCGATCVTISQPLKHPNWASGQSPQAVIIQPIPQDGVENMAIDGTAAGSGVGIFFYNAYQGWVSGVKLTNIAQFFVTNVDVSHMQFQNNYLYNANCTGSCDPYGLRVQNGGDSLFLNNIIEQVRIATNTDGPSAGDVFAYNYSVNQRDFSDFMFGAYWNHSAGDDFQLWEGNVGNQMQNDYLHGTHLDETKFRNFFWGWESCTNTAGNLCGGLTKDSSTTAMFDAAMTRYNNNIGNVQGMATYHTLYQNDAGPNGNVWSVGVPSPPPGPPLDPLTRSTMLRWGNYDTVTGGVHWCGNSSDTGWTSFCAGTNAGGACSGAGCISEVPTGISPYPNSIPTLGDTGIGQSAMPASFLYASKPSWFGSHAWPAIGPDVTSGSVGNCTGTLNAGGAGSYNGLPASSNANCNGKGFSASAWGGHVNLTPAMDCFLNVMGGKPDGTDTSALAFNPTLCYGGSTAPGFSYSPSPVAFGNVNNNTSSPLTVTITNNGNANLVLGTLGAPSNGQFVTSSDTCSGQTIASGNHCTFVNTFTPTSSGLKSATISVPDNAGNPDTINLNGTGVATGPVVSLNPTTLAFGNQAVFTTSVGQSTTLTNTGNATLNITSIVASSSYSISSKTCGSTLAASGSCTVTVVFSPVAIGSTPGTLTFTTNAVSSPDTVTLTGTGVTLSHVKSQAYTTGETSGNSWTFNYVPLNVGDAIAFGIACRSTGGTGVITATALSAPGWTITSLINLTSATTGMFTGLYGAIAPSTASATFTATFTFSSGTAECGAYGAALVDEFTGNNPIGGTATFNASVSSGNSTGSCNQTVNLTPPSSNEGAVFDCFSAATDVTSPWITGASVPLAISEYQIVSGGAGVALNPGYVGGTYYVVQGVTVSPGGQTVAPSAVVQNSVTLSNGAIIK